MSERPVLIIPDVHQDSGFLERCLSIGQSEKVSEILLLGDLLDAKAPMARRPESIRRTLGVVRKLLDEQAPPTSLLWGNHDWMYWSQRILLKVLQEEDESDLGSLLTAGLDPVTVKVLMEPSGNGSERNMSLFERALLAADRSDWLISHAGVHASLWPSGSDLKEGVRILNRKMAVLAEDPTTTDDHPLLGAGPSRGGFHEVGGPLWQDFNAEFEDSLPFPQLIGHTRCIEVMRKGRSYCLDVCQHVCALLHPDGTLETRSAAG